MQKGSCAKALFELAIPNVGPYSRYLTNPCAPVSSEHSSLEFARDQTNAKLIVDVYE